ncbi:MAG: quinoprotein glucose dehydrogenase [Pseudohongiellaceae bacterium]|jgi:quinoprotein glucose dehydrogenase
MIPTGETPNRIKNSPALEGIDIGNTGTGALVPMVVTANMLIYSDAASDGTPMLYAIDKATGEIMKEIEAPGRSSYGMSSWTLDGHQYVLLQTSSTLTALALPAAMSDDDGGH